MPVVRFPRPSTPAAHLANVENFAKARAVSVRFKDNPLAAVRWARTASSLDIDLALAADLALDVVALRRMIVDANKAGDTERAMRLHSVAARLNVEIQKIGKRQRIRGWRQ